jgi:hypothetical protein
MKDIEQFIKDNRDEFDSYQPGSRVWKNLQKQFPETDAKKPVINMMTWMKWSAAAAVILLLGPGVYYFSDSGKKENQASTYEVTDIPDEYAEEVYHFSRLIELKHKELNKIRKEEPELYRKFSADILRLDSSYQMLKKELPGNPNEEMILAAMIENLRIQTDLLNEQLLIIRKIKQNKKHSNEKLYKSA